ncbi:MAG: cupin domain-containing protein [Rhodospirillales bacterium]|nr:cupin domain-containing protein [Rhodospirillales bacterium]MCB9996176.1 cupin domain-containing protein [Rhodospirillales bacterium]
MTRMNQHTEILLMEYAAGVLDDASALLVRTYISISPEARRYVRHCEAMGGQLMERSCTPVAMAGDSLKNVLQQLDRLEQATCQTMSRTHCADIRFCRQYNLPEPLLAYLYEHHRTGRWHPFARGMATCTLTSCKDTNGMAMIRMAPGARAVRHTHRGTEITLVLEGGYEDEYGRYEAGDLVIADAGITHQPIAGPKGCLSINVIEAPLHFTGHLYKLLNLFAR